jgi:hypothetical protein
MIKLSLQPGKFIIALGYLPGWLVTQLASNAAGQQYSLMA